MEDFSLFAHALALASGAAADLGDVPNLSRREFNERETFLFRAQVPCLEYASLLIENALLLRTHRGGRVYAGFERLSSMEAVVDRYMRIADVSARVYAFGEPDWEPPRHPNMTIVRLSGDSRLAREWFVVADSPAMSVALVARSDEDATPGPRERRAFRALKTSDPSLASQLASAADRLADDFLTESRKAS